MWSRLYWFSVPETWLIQVLWHSRHRVVVVREKSLFPNGLNGLAPHRLYGWSQTTGSSKSLSPCQVKYSSSAVRVLPYTRPMRASVRRSPAGVWKIEVWMNSLPTRVISNRTGGSRRVNDPLPGSNPEAIMPGSGSRQARKCLVEPNSATRSE